jgi:hypothetical protein
MVRARTISERRLAMFVHHHPDLAAANIPWHPPRVDILEVIDVVLIPPAAQLRLICCKPKRKYIDHEHEAELNRERVASWRERQADPKHTRACCTVAYEGHVLDGLVKLGQIQDNETGDPRIVGKALSDMLAEAAQDWKAKH